MPGRMLNALRGATRGRRTGLTSALTVVALLAVAGTGLRRRRFTDGNDNPGRTPAPSASPVLATVGDISCQPGAPQEAEKPTDICDQGSGTRPRRGPDRDRHSRSRT